MVSARSLGHYAWECISDILSPEDTWGYDIILAILGYVTQEAKALALQKEHQRDKDKWILKTHITAQNIVT